MMTTPPLHRRMALFLRWAVALLACGYTFLDYWNYNRMNREDPHEWADLLAGRGIAPAQYRVGVLKIAALFGRLGHAPLRHGFAVIDFVCLVLGLWALLQLLTRTPLFRGASVHVQWLLVFLFLAAFELNLFWTFWFQKPETMATFAFLSLSALLTAAGSRLGPIPAIALMIVLAAAEATVRADAAVAFHLGMLIACLLPAGAPMPLGRATQASGSALSIAAAAAVQLYIARVVYPQAPRNVGAFQLLENLRSPMGYVAIVLSLAVWIVTLLLAARRWRTLDRWTQGLLLGSLIHFALFYTLGMAEEVRIFLPFAMAVLPVSVPLLYRWLVESREENLSATPSAPSR